MQPNLNWPKVADTSDLKYVKTKLPNVFKATDVRATFR